MRILILSDSDSPHTIKWAKSLADQNVTIGIFSIHKANIHLYDNINNITIYDMGVSRKIQSKGEKNLSKIMYFKGIRELKKVIGVFKPDILHAHYASSYGFLGALVNFHPYIISMWGSDIIQFPNFSWLHKKILKYSLINADKILSTSISLKEESKKYTNKEILITPFGVDTDKFKPLKVKSIFNDRDIVIGTIKTLEVNYGIEYLIHAFKLLKNKYPDKPLKLLVVGKGSQYEYLKNLTIELGIQKYTMFTGFIDHEQVVNYHNMIDISVFPSIEESFGVAVLEASACAKPVVVSRVGGLPEVVENNITGFIIPKQNVEILVSVLEKLILNFDLRVKMGTNGREKVIKEYNWRMCVNIMMKIYDQIINDK